MNAGDRKVLCGEARRQPLSRRPRFSSAIRPRRGRLPARVRPRPPRSEDRRQGLRPRSARRCACRVLPCLLPAAVRILDPQLCASMFHNGAWFCGIGGAAPESSGAAQPRVPWCCVLGRRAGGARIGGFTGLSRRERSASSACFSASSRAARRFSWFVGCRPEIGRGRRRGPLRSLCEARSLLRSEAKLAPVRCRRNADARTEDGAESL